MHGSMNQLWTLAIYVNDSTTWCCINMLLLNYSESIDGRWVWWTSLCPFLAPCTHDLSFWVYLDKKQWSVRFGQVEDLHHRLQCLHLLEERVGMGGSRISSRSTSKASCASKVPKTRLLLASAAQLGEHCPPLHCGNKGRVNPSMRRHFFSALSVTTSSLRETSKQATADEAVGHCTLGVWGLGSGNWGGNFSFVLGVSGEGTVPACLETEPSVWIAV